MSEGPSVAKAAEFNNVEKAMLEDNDIVEFIKLVGVLTPNKVSKILSGEFDPAKELENFAKEKESGVKKGWYHNGNPAWGSKLAGTGKSGWPAGRPKNIRYVSELVRMMLTWPEFLVKSVWKDTAQPLGVRAAAAQVLLAFQGDDKCMERVLERAEGRPDNEVTVDISGNSVDVALKTGLTTEQMRGAFAKVSEALAAKEHNDSAGQLKP